VRVLLTAVGTRGDVQPALALALELRNLGHEVRLCISPNFVDWAPQWTAENRQFVDRAKPANSRAAETCEFYFVPSSVRKSCCTFVRQLRGPHLSTWA